VGLALLFAAVLLRGAASLSPDRVESLYARSVYPMVRDSWGCAAAVLPFSLAEALAALLVLGLGARVLKAAWDARRTRLRSVARLAADLVAALGLLVLLFLVLWGLNYQRLPLAASAGLVLKPAPPSELLALAEALLDQANALRGLQAEDARGAMRVPSAADVLARASIGFAPLEPHFSFLSARCSAPKPIASSPLFSWLGITGIFVPFTGEANVNTSVPDSDLPFSAAHELAHQRGIAREDEANYVAYLACRAHPDPDFRYAGALAASLYASAALRGVDPEGARRLEARRSPAVGRDLAVLREWSDRHRGPARRASRRINDAYLKAQGQEQGVRSYGRMVDLLLAERRAAPPKAPSPGREG
jgi:hypothetical protein